MGRSENKANNDRQRGSRAKNNRKAPKTLGKRPKHEKLEIKFDPEARKNFLTGASSRKNDRRAYGLAMQKVKDRKHKIEQRKEEKQALKEQVEEAERMKNNDLFDDYDSEDELGNGNVDKNGDNENGKVQMTYEDESTQNQFGGHVIVTTSYGIPSDDDESVGESEKPKNIDTAQRYAGNVEKFMTSLKKKMPSKKAKYQSSAGKAGHKGMHGAQGMIGGNAKDLKMAKKTLSRVEGNSSRGKGGGYEGKGKKGKKGKGRR